MKENYYGVERSSEYLAHYGIRGMKWGVRKAIERGNERALSRQYKKAEKKLAKLERQANNGAKYARRASRLGRGAAVAGGLAIAGTEGVAQGMRAVGKAGHIAAAKLGKGGIGNKAHIGLNQAADAVSKWGASNSVGKGLQKGLAKGTANAQSIANQVGAHGVAGAASQYGNKAAKAAGGLSNNAIARIGAGAVGAGLAAGAAYNMHRAKTTDKKAKQAAKFRAQMEKSFAGTKYANQIGQSRKKRR